MLGGGGEEAGGVMIKLHCVTYIKLSKYKINFFPLSQKDRGRVETESEGRCRRAWQSRTECEMRREQMCSRAERGGLGEDQLLQEVDLEPGPEGSN